MVASIPVSELARSLASPAAPLVIDVRREQFHAASPRMVAGSSWRDPAKIDAWADELPRDRDIIVYCVHGLHVGRNAADKLESRGFAARFLEGGIHGWEAGGGATEAKPVRGVRWITRARPKIDRIACPWLFTRFIDPEAEFIYAPTDQVTSEAERLKAIPYDIPGVDLSHDGPRCSFDAFLREYRLDDPALQRMATIIRGADTGVLELTPQSPGLLAISLGLSHCFADDHEMLRHGMVMYDALHAWCRSLTGESHGWNPTP